MSILVQTVPLTAEAAKVVVSIVGQSMVPAAKGGEALAILLSLQAIADGEHVVVSKSGDDEK